MTIQATPPLPDPLTGRLPQYTQVLQQNNNGQWVIMYDVANIQTTSTTGTVTPIGGTTTVPADPGLTTPITQFPDPIDEDQSPITTPIDPAPVVPIQDPILFQGGQGRDRDPDPTPGIARSPFTGDFYGEDGNRLSDFSQAALRAFLGFTTVGNVISLNGDHDFVTRSLDYQRSIMDQERDAIMGMDVDQRAAVYASLNRAADRMGTTAATAIGSHSGVGLAGFGNINPGMPDAIGTGAEEGRSTDGPRGGAGPYSSQNLATRSFSESTARENAIAGLGGDTNAGGVSSGSTGTGGSTPGPHGQRGGTPDSQGNARGGISAGSTGTGGQSPGPQGQRGGTPSGSGSSGATGTGGQSPGPQGQRGGSNTGGGGTGGNNGGSSGGSSCFVKGTPIQMQNNTTKSIDEIKVGDNTKGGKVWMTMTGAPQTIYNYLGVEVSGSHWVLEDNQFIEVENSKHAVLTDKIEPVYTLITDNHRIFINDIEFADYLQVSDKVWEPHYQTVKENLNKELRGEANG